MKEPYYTETLNFGAPVQKMKEDLLTSRPDYVTAAEYTVSMFNIVVFPSLSL